MFLNLQIFYQGKAFPMGKLGDAELSSFGLCLQYIQQLHIIIKIMNQENYRRIENNYLNIMNLLLFLNRTCGYPILLKYSIARIQFLEMNSDFNMLLLVVSKTLTILLTDKTDSCFTEEKREFRLFHINDSTFMFLLHEYDIFWTFLIITSLIPILDQRSFLVMNRYRTHGGAWLQFRICYYMFALVFVVFDVEIIFLFFIMKDVFSAMGPRGHDHFFISLSNTRDQNS
ncbi:hypothetical protein ACJX0J_037253, partial [Zea mays]